MHAFPDSVPDELALHLGDSCEDREDEPAGGRGRVELGLRKRLEPNAMVFEVSEGRERVQCRPEGAIELPHENPIDSTPVCVLKQPRPPFSMREVTGRGRVHVLERLPAAGEDVLAHRLKLELGVLIFVPR
jgi:hypothetical protein